MKRKLKGSNIASKKQKMDHMFLEIALMDIRYGLYAAIEYLLKVSGKKIMYVDIDLNAMKHRHSTEVLPHQEIVESKKQFFTGEELIKKISLLLYYWGFLSEQLAAILPDIVSYYITSDHYKNDVESNPYAMKALPGMPDHVSMLQKRGETQETVLWKQEQTSRLQTEIDDLKRLIGKDDKVAGYDALQTAVKQKQDQLKRYSDDVYNPALLDYLELRAKEAVDNLGNMKHKYTFWAILSNLPQV